MFESNKISRERLEKILNVQELRMRQNFSEREQKLWEHHEVQIQKLHDMYQNKINEIEVTHSKLTKSTSISRLEKYKNIVNEKIEIINSLNLENKQLRLKLKKYKEAYELYKESRNRIIEIAKEMGCTSNQITLTSAKMDQFFKRLSELAEANQRIGVNIDKKLEDKLYVDEPREDVRLRLIETNEYKSK